MRRLDGTISGAPQDPWRKPDEPRLNSFRMKIAARLLGSLAWTGFGGDPCRSLFCETRIAQIRPRIDDEDLG